MRIVEVNTFHYHRGGDSRYAMALTDGLNDRGHDVAPFAMKHPENFDTGRWNEFFPAEVDYRRLAESKSPSSIWTTLTSSIYNRHARDQFRRLLDAFRPDVVHFHSVMHHLTAAVVLECYERNLPVVWTLHDLKSVCPTTHFLRKGRICEECGGGKFWKALQHRCKRNSWGASAIVTAELYLHRRWQVYEQADLLIAPSRFLHDKVLQQGLQPRRLEILPNFVDASEPVPIPDGDGYVLFVGRLSREKGVATLIEACLRAGVLLRVAGTGELEPELRARAGPGAVVFEGHCDRQRLRDLYQGATLVAVPSECYENCPLVVLEAFAHGRPVMGSKLGGLVDLIQPGRTGWLVEPGSVDDWQEAVAEALASRESCQQLGGAAREEVRTRFSARSHLDTVERWLEEVVEEARRD